MKINILIVEDDANQRTILTGFLRKQNYSVEDTGKPAEALSIIKEKRVDVVLSDLRMPDMDGYELLKEIKKINPEISVILLTAFGSVETAVESMKEGAYDFLTKPVNLDHLVKKISQVTEYRMLKRENEVLRQALEKDPNFDSVITRSPAMEAALSIASRVAPSDASVLILGESGTGKELIARAIHKASALAGKPFVAVNCAALAEGVLESELFGHEKGAFTGASARRIGRFEQASGGTLFLDEIGDIPLNIQVKLLRTIQEGTLERVGGNETVKVKVRLLAATHRDLKQRIEEGLFREDLYYRLNVVTINLPPLRDRKEDIMPLTEKFLEFFAERYKREPFELSPEAKDILLKYDFPGNVRELRNILERASVLCRGNLITPADLNLAPPFSDVPETDGETGHLDTLVAELEKREIRKALDESGGNQSGAARILGISERKLRYKLKKYQMGS